MYVKGYTKQGSPSHPRDHNTGGNLASKDCYSYPSKHQDNPDTLHPQILY
jgi:hypothetical protein